MQDRIKEHERDIRLARTQTSAVSVNANMTTLEHNPLWNEVKFIDRDSYWYTLRVKEAILRGPVSTTHACVQLYIGYVSFFHSGEHFLPFGTTFSLLRAFFSLAQLFFRWRDISFGWCDLVFC